ncbi:MAG: tetratricopeptide repeat protein [Alphaproteobacteria bacterium]|nr:tetratricopeptide repeat protein [Alphaproteobacteria bacterium]
MTGSVLETASALAAAQARHRAGEIAEAIAAYRDILAREPDNPTAVHLLGVASLQTGDAEAAAGLLERAQRLMPANADVLNNLGEALRVLGRHDEAINAYRAALVVAPDHAGAVGNLARYEGSGGDATPAAEPSLARPRAKEEPNTRAALKALVDSGRIDFAFDLARLDSMDSPVAMQSDLAKYFILLIVVAGLAFWFGGLWIGIATTLVGVGIYQMLGRPYQRRRLYARIRAEALADDLLWRQLWRFGGLRLISRDPARPGECVAPDGDWIGFTRGFAVESQGAKD